MNIKFLALHHVGGIQDNPFASSINTTAEQVNQYHKQKWGFISSLGKYGGYNIYINRTGQWTQFRAIGEETAHTLKYNWVSVGICFAGNFIKRNSIPIDTPTPEQIMTYKTLAIAFLDNNQTMLNKLGVVIAPNTEIKITPTNIHKHSYYQPNTEGNIPPYSLNSSIFKK